MQAPLRTEAFLSDESRGDSGTWGVGGSVGLGLGFGGSDFSGGGRANTRSASAGEREQLLGSLTPVLVRKANAD